MLAAQNPIAPSTASPPCEGSRTKAIASGPDAAIGAHRRQAPHQA